MLRFLLWAGISFSVFAANAPKLRLAEVQDISPVKAQAELTLDPHKSDFSGAIQIQVKVNRPTDIVWLNAARVAIAEASIASGGKTWSAKPAPAGDDFVGLQLESELPAGPAEIRIRYSGSVRQRDTAGVFHEADGGNDYLYTQFESIDARAAFPCFDEPAYKIPWRLTLHIPEADQAVSNTPAVSDQTQGGVRTVVFGETKPLPSYLVAFAVGPFEFVDAGTAGRNRTPVRIVVPKGKRAEAKYAAEVTATILTRLEEYFGIPYPYEKSDQVAVPSTLGFGAMENAGMVTYLQTALLANPDSDTIGRQRLYAEWAAHELAHQWFGDLVTTAWWNDIWLNEAFATWMSSRLLADWKPEWNVEASNVSAKLGAAGQDSLLSARKIRQEIHNKADIATAFDDITYQKGAAVIAMFENWTGREAFRRGVQTYLQRYAFRNATAGDFLDSLSSSSRKDLTAAFSTFLNQPGIPTVSVALDCKQHASLHLEQSRYLPIGSKGSGQQLWSIPVCVRYGETAQDRECKLMTQAAMDWQLQTCPAWVEANDNAKGYYRVDYQGGLLKALVSGDVSKRLNAAERADLIGNEEALVSGGKAPAAEALRLVDTFHGDPSRQVLQSALGIALSINRNLVPDDLRPNYERFIQKNFGQRAHELGWTERPGEGQDIRLLRPRVVAAVATLGGDRELAQPARALAEKWLRDRKTVAPDMVGAVLGTAVYYGDMELFKRLLAEYEKSQDRQDQQRLLFAMSGVRQRDAVLLAMQEAISGRVRLSEAFPLLFAGIGWNATRKLPFEFIKQHFNEVMRGDPTVMGTSLATFLPQAGSTFCDPQSRKELADFFTPVAAKYDGQRILAQVMETVDLCIAKVAAQGPGVAEFLRQY